MPDYQSGIFLFATFTTAFIYAISGMYMLKIKGTARIPDYVQLRDDSYTLIAYFRADRPDKALQKAGLGDRLDMLKQFIEAMPFGKLTKFEP